MTGQGCGRGWLSGRSGALFPGPPGGGPDWVSKRARNGWARKSASGCSEINPMAGTALLRGDLYVAGPRHLIIDLLP